MVSDTPLLPRFGDMMGCGDVRMQDASPTLIDVAASLQRRGTKSERKERERGRSGLGLYLVSARLVWV